MERKLCDQCLRGEWPDGHDPCDKCGGCIAHCSTGYGREAHGGLCCTCNLASEPLCEICGIAVATDEMTSTMYCEPCRERALEVA